jgi:PAS domain S-box-containing protein
MSTQNQEHLEQALKLCASEPIHQLGQIQPHGAVLVLSAEPQHTIVQTSSNIHDFIGLTIDEVLGKPLVELIGADPLKEVNALIQKAQTQITACGLIKLTSHPLNIDIDVHLYSSNGLWVLELTNDSGLPKRAKLGELLVEMQQSFLAIENTPENLQYFDQIADLVRKLTDYDSVMIYRFEENWDGTVIAQSRVDAAPSYLGSSFPASDIPPQARALYTQNLVRIVADVTAVPASILPPLNPISQLPLDMTYSALRSLSPIHLEYLKNMQVAGSMVISLLQNGQLWGLISCHQLTPKRVSFAMREAAQFISRMVSEELLLMYLRAENECFKKCTAINSILIKEPNFLLRNDVLQSIGSDLLEVMAATGLIIRIEGVCYSYGQLPEPDALNVLLSWLPSQAPNGQFSCNNLSKHFPSAKNYENVASGLLLVGNNNINNCLIWVRPHQTEGKKWAGHYSQGLQKTAEGQYQLHPRQSFESWTALSEGHSVPWSLQALEIAKNFGNNLMEGLANAQKYQNEINQRLEISDRLEKTTSRLPGFIYTFRLFADGTSCVPFASDGIQDIYRLNAADVRTDASKIFALTHPDDLAGVNASIQESSKKLIPWQHEYRVIYENGQTHWLYGNAIPEPNKETDGSQLWHGFITDISKRKDSESQLRLSDTALNAINQGVLITDIEHNILWANIAFIKLSGYKQAEILGENCRFLQGPLSDPETIKQIKTAVKEQNIFDGEIINYHKDGAAFWNQLTILPIIDDQNRLTNFMSISRDITEQKQININLLGAQQAAIHASVLKSQFLAMMSHEIRTPLNAVLGMQELLTHTPLDSTQAGYLQVATLAGNNLLALVNDILDLTKVEAGKLDLEAIPFNAIEMTQLCVQLLTVTAEAKGLELITIIDPEITPWISGDPLRFRQVLLNLLSNAIKFIEQGSVTVKLSPYTSTDSACVLMVEVIDTGIGIPKDLQASLFDVFVQVDLSDTRKYGGSGLGLPISKRLVALWEGDIGLDSTPLVGSRFWFTVGALATAPRQTLSTIIKQDDNTIPNTSIARVLLVEDSLLNQAVLAAMLRNGGHHVDLADSGSASIAAVKKKHYDIILMDVSMPDMSGMEATAIIRQLGGAAAVVPIIAITAHALAGYQALCLAAGMDGYATKPISQKDLLAVVAMWCDKTVTHLAPISDILIEHSSVQPVYEPVKQAVILDQTALDALTSLLGQEAFNDLLQIYLTELDTRCDAIRQAITQQDLVIISREAHTIKSSSASFGATALQAIAKDIEACGYNDDLPQALILAEQLFPCATATMAAIASIYN